uniref:Uncharacterized protein n=1 Tax=Tanacetum cinerariifolium TaxID=118510 RepID=A0A699I3H4_TANCI|nr:hypothetical protein [Tanacetum cinerariifolium]
MSTLTYVDSETIAQADGAQSSRVLVSLPGNPYVAVRQAQLVDTDTESEPEEAPSKEEELQSLGSRVPLMSKEFEASEPSVTRTDSSHSSASSVSTIPWSPDHPLTHVLPTPTPTRVSFHRRTTRMAVRTQSNLSSCMSARIAGAGALTPFSFWDEVRDEDTKEDESSDADDETKSWGLDDEGQGLEDEGPNMEEEEAGSEGHQQVVLIVDKAASEPLGLGYEAARCLALESTKEITPSMYEIGHSSRSMSEQEGVERIYSFRQPTLVTWVDPEDGRVYTDIPTYVPPAAPVQTPPSPEWSLGSLPVSPLSLVVLSPIASPVATPIATISVDEDQVLKVGKQLEIHESILHDHTKRLDTLSPTLFADIDRDVRSCILALWHAIYDVQRENYDLRMQLAKERRERLVFLDRVARMERRHESRGE